jgi:3-polyprenyl-4-hydroxybenzoate decarboxylase
VPREASSIKNYILSLSGAAGFAMAGVIWQNLTSQLDELKVEVRAVQSEIADLRVASELLKQRLDAFAVVKKKRDDG